VSAARGFSIVVMSIRSPVAFRTAINGIALVLRPIKPPGQCSLSCSALAACITGTGNMLDFLILIDPQKSGNAYIHALDVPRSYGISEEICPASKEMAVHLSQLGYKTAWAVQRKGICAQVTASDLPKSDLNGYCIGTALCSKAMKDLGEAIHLSRFEGNCSTTVVHPR